MKNTNRQYCYTMLNLCEAALTNVTNKNRVLKVKCGQSKRDVMTRVKEQAKTANSSDIVLLHSTGITVRTDDEFHEYLEKKQNINRSKDTLSNDRDISNILKDTTGSEWFDIPLSKLAGNFKRPTNARLSKLGKTAFNNLVYDLIEAAEIYIKECYTDFLKCSQKERYTAGVVPCGAKLMDSTLDKIENDNIKTILWGACPRAQKTKMSLFLSLILDTDITIVCSYVLSAFTSFEEDADYFKQTFDKFVFVDSRDTEYRKKVNDGLKSDKKVIVLMSLCGGINKQTDEDDMLIQSDDQRRLRMGFIKRKKCSKFWIVDEADFGAHLNGQYNVIKEGRKKDDLLLIMTGSNPARAVSNWKVDYYSELLYTDLLIDKQEADRKHLLKLERAQKRKNRK